MGMRVLALFSILLMVGCAQRIKVPINRMMSPEVIGKGAEVEYRDIGWSQGVLDFTDNSVTNPLIMSTLKEEEFYLGLGVAENADLFVRVPKESSSMIGLKVQVLGKGMKSLEAGHKLAFTLAMGSERDEFDQVFTIDLKSDVTDYSVLHGYRVSNLLLLYDGVSITNFRFQGNVKGTNGLDSSTIDYSAKNIIGAYGGAVLGSHQLKLKLELAAQIIEWENTERKTFNYFGLALSGGW